MSLHFGRIIINVHRMRGLGIAREIADPIINVEITRSRINQLAKTLPITLTTFADLGHDISSTMKDSYTPLIEDMLLSRGGQAHTDQKSRTMLRP